MESEKKIIINETIDGKGVNDPKQETKKRNTDLPPVKRGDRYIWGIYIALLLISIIELFSASSTEVKGENVYGPLIRHSIFLALGFVIVIMFQNIHYKYFKNLSWVAGIVTILLLIWTIVDGTNVNGAQRAIEINGFSIQPPEIAKLTIVLLLASILSKNQGYKSINSKGVWQCALVVPIFCVFLIDNGLTNTLMIFCISFATFIIGGMEMKKIVMLLCIYFIFVGCYFGVKNIINDDEEEDTELVAEAEEETKKSGRSATWENRIARFMAGVSPGDAITDENRQPMYAHYAQANGGIWGEGPGNSMERSRLPLAFSDYIYSIIVEDTGIVGGLLLLLLYLLLLLRAGIIAWKCTRAFPCILITGCAVLITFQALVHIAINVGLIPVSGQPLPLISKGGTSVIVMSATIGLMLSVSRFAVQSKDIKEIAQEGKELPEDMQAMNMTQLTYNATKNGNKKN